MAYPQTAPVQPLGVPVRGMNTRDPLANMDPSYAPWVLNMEPEPQGFKIRTGYNTHASVLGTGNILSLNTWGNTKLFAYVIPAAATPCTIWDVTTSTPALSATTGAKTSYDEDEVKAVKYAKRSAFLTKTDIADTARYTGDGSAWAAMGFLYSGNPVTGSSLTSYKGRVYITSGTYLYYSEEVGGVTGTMLRVDLSTLLDEGADIVWSSTLGTPSGLEVDEVFALGTSLGEILVFAGDNPGAVNWQGIAHTRVSRPLNTNATLRIDNDLWLLTITGVVSMRALLSLGADARYKINISDPIDPYWSKLLKASIAHSSTLAQGSVAYWPEENKVYILIGGHIDADGVYSDHSCTFFVYNLITKAWTIQSFYVGATYWPKSLIYFQNNIYFALGPYVISRSTAYEDLNLNILISGDTVAYSYAIHSAYIPGKKDQNQVIGFEPIMKTDFTGSSVTIKAAADFGRKVSAASSQALLAAGGHQNPFYRVGVDGKFYQYRLEGNSDTASTTGLELYNMGVAVK